MNAIVQKYITKPRGRFYVMFVDFKVAFDSVDREKLWQVLHKNGCSGRMYNILQSMYKNVMMCIRLKHNASTHQTSDLKENVDFNVNADYCISDYINADYCITDYFKCMSGVKQGCILSPLLFSLFIAELNHYFSNSTVRNVSLLTNDTETSMLMYADDLTIFADTVFDMQTKIDLLHSFCKKWKLIVNLDKTKMMVFRNGGYLKAIEKWNYGGENIEVISYYAYLGMIFSSRLCWSKCLENYSLKALRMVGAMRNVFNTFKKLPVDLAFKVFDIKIKPIVLYGSQVWGIGYYECIEKVQIQFCKAYLGVGKSTPNDLALLECGRSSLCVDYNMSVIKYWTKLVHMSLDRYPKKCYEQMKLHADMGRKNWVTCIRTLLFSIGFGEVWENQSYLGNVQLFLTDVRSRLKDIDIQNLHSRIKEKENIYINFKSNNFYPSQKVAAYLTMSLNYRNRRVFSLLRTHSLPLKNNLYRCNIVNNNLCEKCNGRGVFVENEFHLLFRCHQYNVLRESLIPEYYRIRPSLEKLHMIINTEDMQLIDFVTLFILQTLYDVA